MVWYFLAGFIAGAVFMLKAAESVVKWLERRFPDEVRRAREERQNDKRSSGDQRYLD